MKLFITDLKKIINRQAFVCKHLSELNAADLARFENIKDEDRALQFLAGRVLILENFGTDFQTLPNEKIISTKGYLSLSHSGDFVALATDDEPVGVDVEKIEQTRDFQKIAQRMKFGNCADSKEFCTKWTAYEADFKLGREFKNPHRRFIEHDGFMICISSLREKEINLKVKNLL